MFFTETLVPKDPALHVVKDDSELAHWERVLKECWAKSLGAYDTETSGFDWFGDSTPLREGPAKIIGHGLAYNDGSGAKGLYFPVRHLTAERQLDPDKVRAMLSGLLGCPDYQIAMHNPKFDLHFARADGIEIRAFIHDTMVMAHMADENSPKDLETACAIWGAVERASEHKDVVKQVFRDLCKRGGYRQKDAPGYALIPIGVLGPYGAADARNTLNLAYKLLPHIQQNWWGLYGTEMRLLRVLFEAEHTGVPLDIPYLTELHDKAVAKSEQLVSEIQKLAKYRINPRSAESIRELLYHRMNMPVNYRTSGGKKSSWDDEDTRKPAVDELALKDMIINNGEIPVLRAILDFREVDKLISTYTKPLIKKTDSRGNLHTTFNQVGTTSGRLSSNDPNLQNIPSNDTAGIRRAFLVPKGKTRVILDFSQVELRVLAFLSKEPTMTKAFIDGEDVHSATSLRMFGNKDKANRRIAKVINFGVAYGMTKHGIRDNLNKQADPERGIPVVTETEAEEFLDQWHGLFPRVSAHIDELCRGMRRFRPASFTNMFGRTRRIPDVSAFGHMQRRAIRQAIAAEVQGTANEMMKQSMVRAKEILDRARAEGRYDGQIVLNVHDEMQIDVNAEGALACASEIKPAMEDFPQFHPIPIIADGEWTSTTWADKTNIWVD